MFGLLNVNKPVGLTSRDVVNRVERAVRPAKAGHAGTLDPIATGVLVVCVGGATRLIEHVQRAPKRYRGRFLLGRTSPSDDIELPAEELPDAPVPTLAEIEAQLPRFTGPIEQVPPAYSAIKVGGKKAYNLARSGQAPDLPPRPVTIHELSVLRYDYPELELDVACGSGTYIRSIGRDLAASLGTGAVMNALERTAIGLFRVEEAIDPEGLTTAQVEASLLPAGLAVADLPRVEVTPEEVEELRHGRFLSPTDRPTGKEMAAFDPTGELVALLTTHPAGKLRPIRVFLERAG